MGEETMKCTGDYSDEELLLDLQRVYHEVGRVSYVLYGCYGAYSGQTLVKRFGSFAQACAIVNIKPGREGARQEPKVIRTCIGCDAPFASPKADPSCRRCATCRQAVSNREDVPDGWEVVAAE